MNKNLLYLLGGGVLIAVVAFAGFMLFSGPSDEAGSSSLPSEEEAPLEQTGEATVRMTTNGFVPQTLSVTQGAVVIFVNDSSRPMWPASAVHPTHQLLPGFDALRGIAPGESYRYTFEGAGRFSYHDHLAPNVTGFIVVN